MKDSSVSNIKDYLTYTQRRLLQAFYYFLNRRYDVRNSEDKILMQNVVYFLQKKHWTNTDYEFCLTQNGMYSAGLDTMLQQLDKKGVYIDIYQKIKIEEIYLADWKALNAWADMYQIAIHKKDMQWIIMLASVYYILSSVHNSLFCTLEMVQQKLKEVQLSDRWTEDVWDVLRREFLY